MTSPFTQAATDVMERLGAELAYATKEVAYVLEPRTGRVVHRVEGTEKYVDLKDYVDDLAGMIVYHNHPPVESPLSSGDIASSVHVRAYATVASTRTQDGGLIFHAAMMRDGAPEVELQKLMFISLFGVPGCTYDRALDTCAAAVSRMFSAQATFHMWRTQCPLASR